MTLRMLDSIEPANLPAGADAYLGYTDGRWPDYQAIARKFGGHVIGLAVFPQDDAEGCDCEAGDLTPGQVPGWVRRQLARGVQRPIVYASASKMASIIALLHGAGISRPRVRLLSAHYGRGEHICAPAVCGYPAADGTQWRDDAPGARGSKVDESALRDDFFGGAPKPKPKPRPRAAATIPGEEPMLLNKGAGARTPIALPDGCTKVRFFASQEARISVDLRTKGQRGVQVDLGYTSTVTLAIPPGIHGIVVHRVDGSDHDVSAVPCA